MGHTWLKRSFTHEEQSLMIYQYAVGKLAIDTIADSHNCSRRTVRSILSRNAVHVRKDPSEFLMGVANARKYQLDETFFDSIDREDKAYYLGMLATDGWIPSRNETVCLSLVDPEPVARFRQCLKFSGEVKTKNPSGLGKKLVHELRVNSRSMVRRLRAIGLGPDKTHTLDRGIMDCVPEHLIHHFIRGFWDGDGGVRHTKRGDLCVYFCGTKSMMEGVSEVLECYAEMGSVKMRKTGVSLYTIEHKGLIKAMMFRAFLFKEATHWMERKKLKLFGTLPRCPARFRTTRQKELFTAMTKNPDYPITE